MTGRSNSAATSRMMKIDFRFEPSQMGRNVAFHTNTLLYDRFHVDHYVVIMMLLAALAMFPVGHRHKENRGPCAVLRHRGTPAMTKTTASHALRQRLIEKALRVSE